MYVELTSWARVGTGRIWFQKGIDKGNGDNEYCGVGLAEVKYNYVCEQLTTKRFSDISADGLLFGADEPKVGSFSCLIEGSFAYLWGEYQGNIILARTCQYMPTSRSLYTFWNGIDYVPNYTTAAPISGFDGIPQGQIVRSHLFSKRKEYVFVGVSKYCDSQIRLGAAEHLEGPWEVWPVCMTKPIDQPNGFRYCMYPHLFASHTRKAELMVTWSEQWPGGVVAGKVKFLTEEEVCEEKCELIG